ncbi:mucosa-associated lymphoid tissue lymphoma translocation protein 1-like [Athalia rosae]|uniref:mucosa-associated lymphoid tissue lymphoma translocation protein 1-like n=1 Tax=Athalia rosae TaxID=37344 RepID=UPI0020346A90|nr:mucosa-associated lymphoid tissue lymphoma translocation protein 1-like [Athalia rosae]XP_020710771.2 mucosa-associated lymphoid tissue lymphoma translocation protein 1-like [Athalia rosae]XP_048512925.1 mucosa-associated lymphoid tissue lymphoma translocation protein 1-like [Athalia rosae]
MLPCVMNTSLDNLPADLNRRLIDELNKNSAWKIIANWVVEKITSLGSQWINSFEQAARLTESRLTPADILLYELDIRLCTVEHLCRILEKCELFDALFILKGPEPLVITVQPYSSEHSQSFKVALGEKFSITCKATSLPPPHYQWFHRDTELKNQTSNTLNILIKSSDQEGHYQCRVRQYNFEGDLVEEKFSTQAPLFIKPMFIRIRKQPESVKVKLYDSCTLSCKAEGHPAPKYQWYKLRKTRYEALKGETSNKLLIDAEKSKCKGIYHCVISNEISTECTEDIEVTIEQPRLRAVAKIALIICNSNYEHHEELFKPSADGAGLAEKLKEIGFAVTCFENLTLSEMRRAILRFCTALTRGVYGVFYFAGHGTKIQETHMLPVDAPKELSRKYIISEEELVAAALRRQPGLFLPILDMCQTAPDSISREDIPLISYEVKNNLLRAYSTCPYESSLESIHADNGIYASSILRHITKDKPVKEVFNDIAHDMSESEDPFIRAQVPMLTSSVWDRIYLTDQLTDDLPLPAEKLINDTTFRPRISSDRLAQNNHEFIITIEPRRRPFINVIQITVSNLDNYNIIYKNEGSRRESELMEPVLHCIGQRCIIFHPQRNVGQWLRISIVRNGKTVAEAALQYMAHIPAIIKDISPLSNYPATADNWYLYFER